MFAGHRFLSGLVLAVILMVGTGSPAAPVDPRREAEDLVKNAAALVESGDLDEALAQLQKAFELDHEPGLLFNIGRVLDRKGDLVQARAYYERFLEAEKDPARLEKGRLRLAELLDRLPGRLVVRTDAPDASVWVDGKAQGAAGEPGVDVTRGMHLVTVSAPGREQQSVKVEVKPGERQEVPVTLRVLPGVLVLRVQPAGARLGIDGGAVVETGDVHRVELAAGTHRLELARAGYEAWQGSVLIVAGEERPLEVLMTPSATPAPALAADPVVPAGDASPVVALPAETRSKVSAAPWAIFGLGGAMLITGGVLNWATVDERSKVTNGATHPDGTMKMSRQEAVDHESQANRYAAASTAMYAIGGVATLTGLIWGIVDAVWQPSASGNGRVQEAPRSGIVVGGGVVSGGAVVMASGRFR